MTRTNYKIQYVDAYGNTDNFQCGGSVGKIDEAIECFNRNIKFATIKKIFIINDNATGWISVKETV